jgi:glycosyltransferase involved in cell wall biosynthesis
MSAPQEIIHLIGTLGQFDLSSALRDLALSQIDGGHRVSVIAFSAGRKARQAFVESGIRCQVIRKRWGYDPFAARQLVQALREAQPTIMHLWGRRATDAALIVRRAASTAKLIATLAKLPQLRNPWWPNRSLDCVDAIVVDRPEVGATFVDAGQGEDRVHVIAPGVPIAIPTNRTRRELCGELGIAYESRILTVAGQLDRWQLVDEAIWAFELIRILHDHSHLVIVGDGPERARLERFARQVTDSAVVRFVPDSNRLGDVLSHSEIYWQGGDSDSIPLTLLTAMSHGVPVVASDVSAHRAVITPNTNGFLVPAAKRAVWARHTDQLMRDAALRAKFTEAGCRTIADRFTLANMTQKYDDLYRQLEPALCIQPS